MPGFDPHPSVFLKPSLLDRITAPSTRDEISGASRVASKSEEPGVSAEVYHDSVLRDLGWLFNSVSPLGLDDERLRRKYPRVAASVLGYGLRGMLGRVVHDLAEVEKQVESSLATFEPRLVVEDMALKVSRTGQLMEIEIRGLLLTQQARRQIWIRTDLETLDSRLKTEANG
jgi:type VI secretion system protein ImpF